MQFSKVRLLSNDGSGHLNELNLKNSVSSLTRRVNELTACSCAPVLAVGQVKAV